MEYNKIMRFRILISTFLLAMTLALLAFRVPTDTLDPAWAAVGQGISYREFRLSNPPNHVYVARMEAKNTQATLETSIAGGFIATDRETVSSMAERYTDAINYWGAETPSRTPAWGTRNQVVAAINGSYWDIRNDPEGVPYNGMVQSGWYAKRFDDCGGYTGFGWDIFRRPFIGGDIRHIPDKQLIRLPDGSTLIFQGINIPRGEDQTVLYTPQYEAMTPTSETGIEVLVEMERPLLILPASQAKGIVRAIHAHKGQTPIPFDHIVISAQGAGESALAALQPGDSIGVSQELSPCNPGDPTPPNSGWNKTYASLGGHFYFLANGAIQYEDFQNNKGATVPDPRTAIAFDGGYTPDNQYTGQYVYFIVVDGRNPGFSNGMTIEQLAIFARDTLSATYAVAQDGGGSSTMVINGEVKNNTYCNNLICDHHLFLPLIHSAPGEENRLLMPSQSTQSRNAAYQRWVANGIMMVEIKPLEQLTTTLSAGDVVSSTGRVEVRLGPGDNYAVLSEISAETLRYGHIVAHTLNGIKAKNAYWWKIDWGEGLIGWSRQEELHK